MNKYKELIKYFPLMEDSVCECHLDGVLLFQEKTYTRTRPMIYNPGICIIIQGKK